MNNIEKKAIKLEKKLFGDDDIVFSDVYKKFQALEEDEQSLLLIDMKPNFDKFHSYLRHVLISEAIKTMITD